MDTQTDTQTKGDKINTMFNLENLCFVFCY